MNLTLTFDPMTLTSYQILALIHIYPHTKFGFILNNSIGDINSNVRLLRTNGRTNGRTNKTIHRDASQSLDASKKQQQKTVKYIITTIMGE